MLFVRCYSVVSDGQLGASLLQNAPPDRVETDTHCLHHPVIARIPGRQIPPEEVAPEVSTEVSRGGGGGAVEGKGGLTPS